MAPRSLRYWDAGVFIALLKPEAWRLDEVNAVLKVAEAGQILVVTSSVSLVEVVKLDAKQAIIEIPAADCAKIEGFFSRSYVSVRLLDFKVGATARDYIWRYGLDTRDSIHLATAVRYHLPQLDTYDQHLLDLNGKISGLNISHPNLPVQFEMADFNFDEAAADEDAEEDESQDAGDPDGI
jgi:predicted nucleic acid-binding protein